MYKWMHLKFVFLLLTYSHSAPITLLFQPFSYSHSAPTTQLLSQCSNHSVILTMLQPLGYSQWSTNVAILPGLSLTWRTTLTCCSCGTWGRPGLRAWRSRPTWPPSTWTGTAPTRHCLQETKQQGIVCRRTTRHCLQENNKTLSAGEKQGTVCRKKTILITSSTKCSFGLWKYGC